MKTILISFNDDKDRDRFLQLLKGTLSALETNRSMEVDVELMRSALASIRLDPPIKSDLERTAAVFVSGTKMAEGTLANMRQRFQQEIGSHSANVEVRELRDGEWIVIQTRRHQR
jgi:hypothetical protein